MICLSLCNCSSLPILSSSHLLSPPLPSPPHLPSPVPLTLSYARSKPTCTKSHSRSQYTSAMKQKSFLSARTLLMACAQNSSAGLLGRGTAAKRDALAAGPAAEEAASAPPLAPAPPSAAGAAAAAPAAPSLCPLLKLPPLGAALGQVRAKTFDSCSMAMSLRMPSASPLLTMLQEEKEEVGYSCVITAAP